MINTDDQDGPEVFNHKAIRRQYRSSYTEETKEVTEQSCRAIAAAGGEARPGRVGQEG
jgi:hypothetical protein